MVIVSLSHSFGKTFADSPELLIDFTGWATQDERADGVAGALNVVEAAEDVDFGLGDDDSRSR